MVTDKRGIVLSKKDLLRVKVIGMFRERRLSRSEASKRLDLSERQISRLAKAYREHGPAGLLHKGRGRVPKNKKPEQTKDRLISLYRERYPKFNRQHAMEMMLKHGEIEEGEVSYATFNRWCCEQGLGKHRRRRSSKAYVQRERYAEEGGMLQLDGSDHHWFGEKVDKHTLLSFIDDATSKLPYFQFHPSETTWACFTGLRCVVEENGIPEVILTDRAGWSARGDKRFHFSQFARLCEDLGIVLIATSSPQTKGRVERAFGTAQDRLVAELDYYGIKTCQDGNRYIEQCFKPEWEERFAVEARYKSTRYRPVPEWLDLDEHFCMKYQRQGNKNNTVSYDGETYRIINREYGSLHRKKIMVHVNQKGGLSFFYAGKRLNAQLVKKPTRQWKAS